jgi:hypothetical protein
MGAMKVVMCANETAAYALSTWVTTMRKPLQNIALFTAFRRYRFTAGN